MNDGEINGSIRRLQDLVKQIQAQVRGLEVLEKAASRKIMKLEKEVAELRRADEKEEQETEGDITL